MMTSHSAISDCMRFVVVAGITTTARINGISAAGANPDVLVHTPSADLEIIEYGQPISENIVPVSPTGCPTPAVVTRAVCELIGFDLLLLNAGLARSTAAPTVAIGTEPGADIREAVPVPTAAEVFEEARQLGRTLPDDELVIGETIPGGTTTSLGVLTALGERAVVSSSLPKNPLALKREVVNEALAATGLSPGATAGKPVETVRRMGDPVLAGVAGLVVGATETGTRVTLAGGTQLVAAAALVRHSGVNAPLSLATTAFIAADETIDLNELATDLSLAVTITDPKFDQVDHPATNAYLAGEAKEGVGMGGALALADRSNIPMRDVHEQIIAVYGDLTGDEPSVDT